MRVSLNNAERGEFWEVETFGDHLGADDNVVVAGSDVVVDFIEGLCGVGVGVEAGDFGVREEARELILDGFGAEALVVNAGVMAFRARGWNGVGAAANVTAHLEFIGVQDERQIAIFAE